MTFVYLEEGIPLDAGYQGTESSASVEQAEVTHISETALGDTSTSIGGEASQPASASILMDLASKRMVDDLVDSETADDCEMANVDVDLANNLADAVLQPSLTSGTGSKGFANETSYGPIGSSTAREHFQEPEDEPQVPLRPLLPSILNSPFAPQPGEATIASRPSTARRTTPSHSKENSLSGIPPQYQPNALNVGSSVSSIPDPSNYNAYPHVDGGYQNQPYLNTSFPTATNYTTGYRASANHRDETYGPLDASTFHSSSLDWEGSGRLYVATNVPTPPNGQGAG